MDSSIGSCYDSEEDEIYMGTIADKENMLYVKSECLSRKTMTPNQRDSGDNCSPRIGLQKVTDDVATKEEKDMLLLALQRRFEKHKVDLPDLCDLDLDDTAAESENRIITNQCDSSLELLANSSMPQFSDSPIDSILCKRGGNAIEFDTTAKFVEMEKSCMSPSESNEHEQLTRTELSLAADDLSTVSADEDGGFLSGLTKVALYHEALNRNSLVPDLLQLSDLNELTEVNINSGGQKDENDADISLINIPDMIDFSKSPAPRGSRILDVDDSADVSFSMESPLNNTLDDLKMLETFGVHYMVSAEKDLQKKGLENSMNVSLSKEQQELLDSFAEPEGFTPKQLNVAAKRDISKKFGPCDLKTIPSPFKDVIAKNADLNVMEDFKFPKPLNTVGGNQSKYQHRLTPIKPHAEKLEPARSVTGQKFFSSSPADLNVPKKATKFFSESSPAQGKNREIRKNQSKTPGSSSKLLPDLKNIQSPIGRYINSPVPSLMAQRQVPIPGQLKGRKILSVEINEEKAPSTENVDLNNVARYNMALPPQRSYQSTTSLKMVVPTKTKLPVLSGKSKPLLTTPKPIVMKHTGRVKASELPSGSPISKLPPPVNDSCFSDLTLNTDVSVMVAKEAMKTSTMKST